jgi:Ser/Thr protein kinase RdoA (MazF antagonist)
MTQSTNKVPYAGLSPERVIEIAADAGLEPDGRLFALNSYENRVYRVGSDNGPPWVLKFYRAGRWSDAQILEEHEFARELAQFDLAVVPPIDVQGSSLWHTHGFRVAAFPLVAGSAPPVDLPGNLELVGRALGRLHACGARRLFQHRADLQPLRIGEQSQRDVLRSACLPPHCEQRYASVSQALIAAMADRLQAVGEATSIRLHGDCHLGNLLWNQNGPLFVDLDDCQNGPALQDLWMFLSGNGDEQRRQWSELCNGYEQFAHFDYATLGAVEVLRAARMLHHTAWIARRWDDPAFPKAFPDFAENHYWEQLLRDLAEQTELVNHPPLLQA